MLTVEILNILIEEKYESSSYDSLLQTYQRLTKELNSLSERFNIETPTPASRFMLIYKSGLFFGIASEVIRGTNDKVDVVKRAIMYQDGATPWMNIFKNLILMIQLMKLILDKTSPAQKEKTYIAIKNFVQGSKAILLHEFRASSQSMSVRIEVMELIQTILSHKKLLHDKIVKESFRSLALSLVQDLKGDDFLSVLSNEFNPIINRERHALRESARDLPGDAKIDKTVKFNQDVLPLRVQEHVSKPIDELVNFILADTVLMPTQEEKAMICASLMRNLKFIAVDNIQSSTMTAGRSFVHNAIVNASISAARRMKGFVKREDVQWLEDAALYDTSVATSRETLIAQWNKRVLLSWTVMTVALGITVSGFSLTGDDTIKPMCHSAASAALLSCFRYLDLYPSDVLVASMKIPKSLRPDPPFVFESNDETLSDSTSVSDEQTVTEYFSDIWENEDKPVERKLSEEEILKGAYDDYHAEVKTFITSKMINDSPYKTEIRKALRPIEESKLPFDKRYFHGPENVFDANAYRIDFYKAYINIFVKYPSDTILDKWFEFLKKSPDLVIRKHWGDTLKNEGRDKEWEKWNALIVPVRFRSTGGPIGSGRPVMKI